MRVSKNLIFVIIGAVILCFAGFKNKYPFLTNNSGYYIDSGFKNEFDHRVIGLYGLFVAHSSWGVSLWLVIFSQAMMLSVLLFYYFRLLSGSAYSMAFYLACLFFIAFCSPGSLETSTIGPTVFESIALLGTGLLLFAKDISRRDFLIIALITAISAGMDIQSFLIPLLLVICFSFGLLFKRTDAITNTIRVSGKNVLNTGSAILLSGLMLMTLYLSTAAADSVMSGNDLVRIKHPAKFFDQFLNIRESRYPSMNTRSEALVSINKWYNAETRESTISWQSEHMLNFKYLNYIQLISIIISLSIYIWMIIKRKGLRYKNVLLYLLLAFLLHALISTGLYLNGRLNNIPIHTAWLLPVPVFIYLSVLVDNSKLVERLKTVINRNDI